MSVLSHPDKDARNWRQIVTRLLQLIRLPLNPHDPPRLPANSHWAIEQAWREIDRGLLLTAEGYIKLGNVAVGMQQFELARRSYLLAFDAPTSTDTATYCCLIACTNGAHVAILQKDFRHAIQLATQGMKVLEQESEHGAERCDLLLLLAAGHQHLGKDRQEWSALTEALVLSRTLADQRREGLIWMRFVRRDYVAGELAAALEKCRKALDLFAVAGAHQELVRAYYNAALLSAEFGDSSAAIGQLERARELMRTHRVEYDEGKIERLLAELSASPPATQL